MDIFGSVLQALAAKQAVNAAKEQVRGGLITIALGLICIALLIGGFGFIASASYSALLAAVSPAAAAAIVGFVLLLLAAGLGFYITKQMSGGHKSAGQAQSAPQFDIESLEQTLNVVSAEVKKNPGTSLLLACAAGFLAYDTFIKPRR